MNAKKWRDDSGCVRVDLTGKHTSGREMATRCLLDGALPWCRPSHVSEAGHYRIYGAKMQSFTNGVLGNCVRILLWP